VGDVRWAVARSAHEIPARGPLRLVVGDEVQVGERDTEWPEFVFVTAAHGSGWVPARHLSSDTGEVVVRIAYDTTELPTREGEVLEVIDEDVRSGWLWCRAGDRREGWVPTKTVKPLD
jgi:variant SH3 domain-containing protein